MKSEIIFYRYYHDAERFKVLIPLKRTETQSEWMDDVVVNDSYFPRRGQAFTARLQQAGIAVFLTRKAFCRYA